MKAKSNDRVHIEVKDEDAFASCLQEKNGEMLFLVPEVFVSCKGYVLKIPINAINGDLVTVRQGVYGDDGDI